MLCAPTVGAALLTVISPSYTLGLDAASYLMSALLLLSIRRPFARPQYGRTLGCARISARACGSSGSSR